MLFTEMLKFLWAALRHWMVWVTGTGIVGFALWMFSLYERKRGEQMKMRTYALILFCTFWFLATFSAWRDADSALNSTTVAKAHDDAQWQECRSDLKAANVYERGLQTTINDQRQTIDSERQMNSKQQIDVNNCVVSLGKMNPIINTHLTVADATPVSQQKRDRWGVVTETEYFYVIAIMTNRKIEPRGILTCDKAFDLYRVDLKPNTDTPMRMTSSPLIRKISDTKYRVSIYDTSASWTDGNPIMANASSSAPALSCSFAREE